MLTRTREARQILRSFIRPRRRTCRLAALYLDAHTWMQNRAVPLFGPSIVFDLPPPGIAQKYTAQLPSGVHQRRRGRLLRLRRYRREGGRKRRWSATSLREGGTALAHFRRKRLIFQRSQIDLYTG